MKHINLNKFNSTKAYLRSQTKQWKKDSLKNNKKCLITGNVNGLEVHHHNKAFNEIIEETFKQAKLEYYDKTFCYSQAELDKLSNICLALHYKYGLGVPIAHKVHQALHQTYGSCVSKEQFYEFKRQYKATITNKYNTNRKVS